MSKNLQNLSPETIAMLIFITCGAAIHFGGGWLKRYALELPATQVLKRDPPPQASYPQAGAIHIIREAHGQHAATSPTSPQKSNIEFDTNQLFNYVPKVNKPEIATPTEAPSTDYFAQLMATQATNLRLNALMHNGAMINGRFVALRKSVDSVAYPSAGGDDNNPATFTAPILVAINHKQQNATIADPANRRRYITLTLD